MKKKRALIIIIIFLMIFSLINNYSASFILPLYKNYFLKELFWYIVSFTLIFIISKLNIKYFFKYSFYLYLFGNFILLITLFAGHNVNGSTSWLSLGPFSFQPSEFFKIVLIIYLYEFTKVHSKLKDWQYILITFLIVLLPSILTFLEPDTGAVIMYLIIYLSFLIIKKLNKWWYICGIGITILLGSAFLFFYYNFQDLFINIFGTSFFYRMDRITNFLSGEGYQLNNALISIGTSGLFGRGLTNIPIYFPEAPTDFAFALLINNIGIIGIIIFLIIYGLLIYHLIIILNKKNEKFIFPVILLLISQFTINILMNIGLFPIMGITLPFISYGGSNLLSYMILMGLIINIKKVS